ncbi:MAG: FtsX-like permease family protein [Candidatus Limnocylindrales bacterium]
MGGILGLVGARLRGRRGQASSTVLAISGGTALMAVLIGIASIAADRTVQRTIAGQAPIDRAFRVSRFITPPHVPETLDADARGALAHIGGFTSDVQIGSIVRRAGDPSGYGLQLTLATGLDRLLTLSEGRLPAPCDGVGPCEAILLSEVAQPPDLPSTVMYPGLELRIVGRGIITGPSPFAELPQTGPERPPPDDSFELEELPAPALLMVDASPDVLQPTPAVVGQGVRPTKVGDLSRTDFWSVQLEPETVHPWTMDALRAGAVQAKTVLAEADSAFTMTDPTGTLDASLARARAASGLLLVVGSIGAAAFLAFAWFAALAARADLAAEWRRLTRLGARPWQLGLFVAAETVIPAIIGVFVGVVAAAIALFALANWQGVPVGPVLSAALTEAGAIRILLLVAVLATVVSALGLIPPLRRSGVWRLVPAVALTAAVILGWQLWSSGALSPQGLSEGAGPVAVLLPAVGAFLVAGLVLVLVPILFRAAARRARHAPVLARLALLSVARDPDRPAATLALLSFSIGALVFGLSYGASLRQGITDQAAFRAAIDVRLTEAPSGVTFVPSVVPFDRYATLEPEARAYPALSLDLTAAGAGRTRLIGVDPKALPLLTGWRSDFSDESLASMAAGIAVAGDWTLRGQALSPGEPRLTLGVDWVGDRLSVRAAVITPKGDATILYLGLVQEGITEISAPLPPDANGGTLIALTLGNSTLIGGEYHPGAPQHAEVRFHGAEAVTGTEPLIVDTDGSNPTFTVRAPQAADALVLPAIVSPQLAASAGADGELGMTLGTGQSFTVKVVGTSKWFPSVVAGDRFAIVDLAPLLSEIRGQSPGTVPNEAWIDVVPTADRDAVIARLTEAPFRPATVVDRWAIEADRVADPLAQAIIWALLLASATGLGFALLGLLSGLRADLADQSGELADLEAQGLGPAALRRHALARSAWLAISGVIAGVGVGAVLAVVVTGTFAVSVDAVTPVPPLETVIPVVAIGGIILALVALLAIAGAVLARRAYRSGVLWRSGG